MMESRPNDQFGIGWYAMKVGNPTLSTLNRFHDFVRDENGIEFYYSLALTPWAMLTPDIQFVHPAQKRTLGGASVDTATVMGLRLQLIL